MHFTCYQVRGGLATSLRKAEAGAELLGPTDLSSQRRSMLLQLLPSAVVTPSAGAIPLERRLTLGQPSIIACHSALEMWLPVSAAIPICPRLLFLEVSATSLTICWRFCRRPAAENLNMCCCFGKQQCHVVLCMAAWWHVNRHDLLGYCAFGLKHCRSTFVTRILKLKFHVLM